MNRFRKIFPAGKPVIAMIHTDALPGTPLYGGNLGEITDKALHHAEIYARAGVDALMIENMHDVPYLKRQVGPEITAAMTRIATEIKARFPMMPLGIQILAGANRQALAAALVSGAEFIRAEGFVFGHLADEGLMDADAGPLLRYRKLLGAEHIAIFTDIKKKHSSHSITADVSLEETARAAAFFLSDGLIVTGNSTGHEPDAMEVRKARRAQLPVLIGSGLTADNLPAYYVHADAFIVGSYFKKDGRWQNDPDPERIRRFMEVKKSLDNHD